MLSSRRLMLLLFWVCSAIFHVYGGNAPYRHYIREAGESDCSSGHTCLKLQLLLLAGRLANRTRVEVGPGVAVVSTDRTRTIVDRLRPLAISPLLPLRPFLGQLIADYLGSLNLTFQLKDSTLLSHVNSYSLQLWNSPSSIGRAKYKTSWYAMGMISVVGFALLASLCGKALMASMMAVALSALVALRAGGFSMAAAFASPPAKVTQYEIITKPAYVSAPSTHYIDHEHHHTVGGSYGKRDFEGSKEG